MRGSRPKRSDRRAGVAALELAILLPFIILLAGIAIDYCRIFYYTQTLQSSAQNAALVLAGHVKIPATVSPEEGAYQAAEEEGAKLNPALKREQLTLASTSNDATVTVKYEFRTFLGYLGIPEQVTITRAVKLPKAGV